MSCPTVLVVATGTEGGIGRFERLMETALGDLEASGSVNVRWQMRRQHPEYLETRGQRHPAATQTAAHTPSAARFALAVTREIVSLRPDLVIFGHPNLAQLAGVTATLRIPHLVIAYGLEVLTRLSPIKRWSLRQAKTVVAISDFTATALIDVQGVSEDNVTVVPLALEPSWLVGLDSVSPRTHATRRILSVSRLSTDARNKGIEHVINSLRGVLERHPNIEYRVVGEGDDVPRLRELAVAAGVQDHVTFTGALAHRDLLQEYADADVFVLPAETEGFGLVFLEAMAFSTPVIARAAGAAPEVVAEGQTGLLIRRTAEIAPAVNDLLGDARRATEMGVAGKQRALETFAYRRFVKRLDGTLRGALEPLRTHGRRR